MALLPTIPTSFVPHIASDERRHGRTDMGGAFALVSYAVLALVFALAIGVFAYGRILAASQSSKDAALASAEASIDPATVESFVQLRDRLNASQGLLASHIAFSNFFSALDTIMPATVRFLTLHLAVDATGVATVEGTGVAKSFNALSAASEAFATDGRIKDAIFSKMNINKDMSVSFGFSASLDPKLIAFTPSTSPTVTATSTATSTFP